MSGMPSPSIIPPLAPPADLRVSSIIIVRASSCLGNILVWGLKRSSGLSVDLADVSLQRLVLPMDDHRPCGTLFCLRKITAATIYEGSRNPRSVISGRPIVLGMLIHAVETDRKPLCPYS